MRTARLPTVGTSNATTTARLHADGRWRHYRGTHSDEFLDSDVLANRLAVWSARLAARAAAATIPRRGR